VILVCNPSPLIRLTTINSGDRKQKKSTTTPTVYTRSVAIVDVACTHHGDIVIILQRQPEDFFVDICGGGFDYYYYYYDYD
jgi:hypothetical protein